MGVKSNISKGCLYMGVDYSEVLLINGWVAR